MKSKIHYTTKCKTLIAAKRGHLFCTERYDKNVRDGGIMFMKSSL